MNIKKSLFVSLIASSFCLGDSINLADACKVGIENDPSIKSYEFQIKSLDEDIEQAKSKLLPQIEATSTYMNRKGLVNISDKYEKEEVNSYSVNLRQTIYHPENYAAIKKSKLKSNSEYFGIEYHKQEIFEKVSEAYLNVLKAQNRVNLSKYYIESTELNFKQIEKMYKLELADKMKYFQSMTDYDNAKLNFQNNVNQLNIALATFNMITGTKKYPENITTNDVDLVLLEKSTNLDNNYKVKQLEENSKSLLSDIEYAKYQNYPKIDFSASYTKYDPDNKLVTDYLNDKTFKLELRLPIYTGGYINSLQKKNEFLYKAGIYDIEDAKRKEQTLLDDAIAKYNAAKSSIGLYNKLLESSQLYLYSISQAYEKGLKSEVELADAKSKLEETKYKINDNFYEYITNGLKILKLNGTLNLENIEILNQKFKNGS